MTAQVQDVYMMSENSKRMDSRCEHAQCQHSQCREAVNVLKIATDALHQAPEPGTSHVAPEGIAWINIDLTRLVGDDVAAALEQSPEIFAGEPVGVLHHSPGFKAFAQQFFSGPDNWASVEIEVDVEDAQRFFLLVAQKYLDGKAAIFVGIDLSQRREAELQLRHSALHDALTGLPNRVLFMDRLQQTLERVKRRQQAMLCVLFIDLDRFKVINDSLGHLTGDQLLITMARRLESCLRPGDTVARLGGDEFAVLLEDIDGSGDAVKAAERIQAAINLPVTLAGQDVYTSASIGIALSTPESEQPADLLRDADTAMYRAKAHGKAGYAIFNAAMHAEVVRRLQWETALRRALEDEKNDELQIAYQPIVCLQSEQIIGFEALLRWQHPEYGLVLPDQFLPVAEETGLVVPLDRWMLKEACRQLRFWQQSFDVPSLTVSVNLSSRHLAQPDLVPYLERILNETGISTGSLILEISESTLSQGALSSSLMLGRLGAMGVPLSMDRFGTGYSSISLLHRFPLDTLKIDRSLTRHICTQESDLTIVRAIISLAHSLGKKVVVEGIETPQQLLLLKALHCEYGQGYLFSKPVDGHMAHDLIEQQALQMGRPASQEQTRSFALSNRPLADKFRPKRRSLQLLG